MTDLPRKAVVRSAKLASVPLGFAGRTALGLGKRIGGKPAEVVAAELQARTAQQLFQVLGELKGGAMKFGQALSIFEAAFPEELAGPLPRDAHQAAGQRAADADELGARACCAPTSARAGAAGSPRSTTTPWPRPRSARCTAAVWTDGRDVAVKIQYPGAGAALDGRPPPDLAGSPRSPRAGCPGLDLGPDPRRAARPDGRGARLPPRGRVAGDLRSGLRRRRRLRHPRRRRRHASTSSCRSGSRASRCRRSSPTARPSSATTPRSSTSSSSSPGRREAGLLHADPHPGNFRMTPDDRLGVIDFGAVNRLPDGMPPEIGPLLTTGLEGSARGRARRVCATSASCSSRHRPRPAAAARLPRAVHGALPRRRVHLQPRLAARRLRPHQRPAAAQLRRRLQAQPAAGVPPHPPRVGWQHRRALPARRHGARTRASSTRSSRAPTCRRSAGAATG